MDDWTPHRCEDGAEAALEAHGLAWLAEPWILDGEAEGALRVRMVEFTPDRDGFTL